MPKKRLQYRPQGRERKLEMLDRLKNFTVDRMSIEELIELSAYATLMTNECQSLKMPVPEWVTEQQKTLVTEVSRRDADRKASRLKELKSRRSELRTVDEKRKDLESEIAELESMV